MMIMTESQSRRERPRKADLPSTSLPMHVHTPTRADLALQKGLAAAIEIRVLRISQVAFHALTGTGVPFRMSPTFPSCQALTQLMPT